MNYSLCNDRQFADLLYDRSIIYIEEIGSQLAIIPESYIHYQAYDDIRCRSIEYNPTINAFVDDKMYLFAADVLSLHSMMKNYRIKYLLVRDIPLSEIQRAISDRGRWLEHLHIQGGDTDISDLTLPRLTHFSIIGHDVHLDLTQSMESLEYLNIDSTAYVRHGIRFDRLKYLRYPEPLDHLPESLEYLNIDSISNRWKIPHAHTIKLKRASPRDIKSLPSSVIHLEIGELICDDIDLLPTDHLENLIALDVHLNHCENLTLRDTEKLVYLGITSNGNDAIVDRINWNRLQNLRRLIVKFDPMIPEILRDRPDVQIIFYNMSVGDINEHRELLNSDNIEYYIEEFDQDPSALFCGDEKFMFSIRDSLIRHYIRDIERLCD